MNPKQAETYEKGRTFGWLTVIRQYQGIRPLGRTGIRYKLRCKCGAEHDVSYENLRYGRVIACRRCSREARREEMEG